MLMSGGAGTARLALTAAGAERRSPGWGCWPAVAPGHRRRAPRRCRPRHRNPDGRLSVRLGEAPLDAVPEHGRVVEHGRHHQLLAKGGHYAQMWARQQAAPAA